MAASQIGIPRSEFCVAAGFEDVAVSNDHPIEVPFEDFRDRFARSFAVADCLLDQAMRSEGTASADESVEDSRLLEIGRHVEDQVRENHGAG